MIRQYVLARSDGAARVNLPESSKSASLRSIEIVGEDGEPATEIPGQNPFRIRALYTVHSPLPGLQLDLAVNNHLGQRLFTARYTGAGPDATAQPGNYEAELSIPGDLLVPGEYSFDTTFHQPYVKYHDIQQHVISVRILATSPHAHWMGKDPGSLFITLPFTSRPSASLPE